MTNANQAAFSDFGREADALIDPSRVRVAFDLGSRDGEVALYLKEHYPKAKVFAFECNPPAVALARRNIGERKDVIVVDRAVSDVNGKLDFYAIDPEKTITPHADGNIGASSLYRANPDYPYETYVQKTISVESVRLQDWAAQQRIKSIDVIWMDLQGAELRALQGLGDLLATVKVIYAEVEYKEMYIGQPLAADIRQYLAEWGFVLHKRVTGGDWFGDELYYRIGSSPWWKERLARWRHGVFQRKERAQVA